jgi:hypothetical protein
MATFVKKATLLLCPFCGSRGIQSAQRLKVWTKEGCFSRSRYHTYFIRCTNKQCRANGPHCKTSKAAIATWNYRPFELSHLNKGETIDE